MLDFLGVLYPLKVSMTLSLDALAVSDVADSFKVLRCLKYTVSWCVDFSDVSGVLDSLKVLHFLAALFLCVPGR